MQRTTPLTPEDLWRAVVLYGANTATYKLALALALAEYARRQQTEVRLEDLAHSFFDHYRDRVAAGLPQQSIPGRKTEVERAIDACQAGELTQAQAIERIRRRGFNDVIPRFHTVNGAPIPRAFYEVTPVGIVLT